MSVSDFSQEATLKSIKEIIRAVENPMVDDWDPIELGLLLAKLEYEHLNVEQQKEEAQRILKTVQEGFPRESSLREQTAYLLTAFKESLGFEGDSHNYYNVRNSFLNDVFLRRKGIPISLSLVFMGLCREVGLKAVGISFPGHFLVKMIPQEGDQKKDAETDAWYVDTFESSKLLSLSDCEERLSSWTRGMIPFGPEVLKVAHPSEILSRMLRNLRAIYAEKEDWSRLYWVLSALVELCPADRLESLKERGFLFARMGRYRSAIEDLRAYLNSSNSRGNVDHIEKMLRYFELQKDLMN